MDKRYAIVTTACVGEDEAERIAAVLLEQGLVACIQAFPVVSRYVWKGELRKEKEILLFIKCRGDLYPDIERVILEHHSYDLPEILLTPVRGGYGKYLDWIEENSLG